MQSNALEYSFKRNGIPYRIIGGTRYFDRAEVKDMLAYLWVLNNRSDDLRLRRVINNPPRGLGGKTMEMVERLAQAEGRPLYDIISHPEAYAALERPAEKLQKFTQMLEGCAGLLEDGMSLPDFYEELLIRTGYAAMLQEKNTEENQARLENVRELKSTIVSYVEHAEEPTLAGFLEEIALYTDIEQYDASAGRGGHDDDAQRQRPGVSSGVFSRTGGGTLSGIRAIGEPEEMEEERRLCYVAITRARERLTISYAHQRMLYGRTNACLPSRFLKEIPDSCVEYRGGYHAEATAPRAAYGESSGAPSHGRSQRVNPSVEKRKAHIKQAERSDFTAPASQVLVDYHPGDLVVHKAFGKGMVLSVMKMGGDALLEVAFDQVGTKRLMAKTASSHMKKA